MREPIFIRDTIFWLMIVILFGIATAECGYIYGKQEYFDYEGKLCIHETKIKFLESEMRLVKEKVRIPK